ncbi:hypothetical protein [Aquabacterium sp.]|uniref:hypothetical protein n=1 Tax=Aquabacterium sp. TaxID=1872578 RepID=UPI002487BD91|nr:hypothetical protein [Aquabacterium sp.]MDI1259553.1 hypothetical protein [Aquabacterium sp.]
MVAALALAGWSAVQAATYELIGLGSYGGSSAATDINNLGQIVGNADVLDQYGWASQAFSYQFGVGAVNLGAGRGSTAQAINDAGLIVGSHGPFLRTTAFSYTASGGLQDIAVSGSYASEGTAVNKQGQIGVAWVSAKTLTAKTPAIVVQPDRSQSALTSLGGQSSRIHGINSAGVIVGQVSASTLAPDNTQAFQMNPDGSTFVWNMPYGSTANAINDQGAIVGSINNQDMAHGSQAFLYTPGQGVQTLAWDHSRALDINSLGWVIGQYRVDSYRQGSFLYQPGVGVSDLQSLLPEDERWSQLSAAAINDLGQIVGSGLYQGHREAFVMNLTGRGITAVPEAGTHGLMALGLVGIGALTRRQHRRA